MEENLSFGTGPLSEATPELVSQDRRAGGESRQASEHRQILRSAQMGAGSNAGPHFSLSCLVAFISVACASQSPFTSFAAPVLHWRNGKGGESRCV